MSPQTGHLERERVRHNLSVRHRLAFVQQRLTEGEQKRDELVAELIAAGGTWRDVGEALGITPQAASRRYRNPG